MRLSFLKGVSSKYDVAERGEGLRTSWRIFWRVRQSAGERLDPRELVGVERELILSSPCKDGLSPNEVDRGGVEGITVGGGCGPSWVLLFGDDMINTWNNTLLVEVVAIKMNGDCEGGTRRGTGEQ